MGRTPAQRLVHELNGHLQTLTGRGRAAGARQPPEPRYSYLLAERLDGEDAAMAGEIAHAAHEVAAIVARLHGPGAQAPRRAP